MIRLGLTGLEATTAFARGIASAASSANIRGRGLTQRAVEPWATVQGRALAPVGWDLDRCAQLTVPMFRGARSGVEFLGESGDASVAPQVRPRRVSSLKVSRSCGCARGARRVRCSSGTRPWLRL